MTPKEKIDIIQDAIDILNFHIGSTHSDTDDDEKKIVQQLETLQNDL